MAKQCALCKINTKDFEYVNNTEIVCLSCYYDQILILSLNQGNDDNKELQKE